MSETPPPATSLRILDAAAPPYGQRRLEDHFRELVASEDGGER
ncbi:hypothetical protein [Brachybacterium sacelli]|uniref:Uncharacterized protein n=1 Tax=Brachybacterium sacelli TaxID=173364 RepID=A0ABS4X010_9MICO|nr:hypothetical protein [Brachybacterium sacelli]MBP2381563.1 hypothetical protein [Brachybacterium sacelli]